MGRGVFPALREATAEKLHQNSSHQLLLCFKTKASPRCFHKFQRINFPFLTQGLITIFFYTSSWVESFVVDMRIEYVFSAYCHCCVALITSNSQEVVIWKVLFQPSNHWYFRKSFASEQRYLSEHWRSFGI